MWPAPIARKILKLKYSRLRNAFPGRGTGGRAQSTVMVSVMVWETPVDVRSTGME